MHYPSDPLQPGPVFFLTPRKCSIFGVHCEAFPRQVNFLCDEAGDCGKGSNTVISQLHFFFENHRLGKETSFLLVNHLSEGIHEPTLPLLHWNATPKYTKCFTSPFSILQARLMCSSMQTTALGRTRITMFCGICCGGPSQEGTVTSCCQWVTLSSLPIGVSAFLSGCSVGPKWEV